MYNYFHKTDFKRFYNGSFAAKINKICGSNAKVTFILNDSIIAPWKSQRALREVC